MPNKHKIFAHIRLLYLRFAFWIMSEQINTRIICAALLPFSNQQLQRKQLHFFLFKELYIQKIPAGFPFEIINYFDFLFSI